uniref:Lysyl oxidase homolog n=1 Tax=Maylandia zebra TaxID=106582 RepID=A0A3P9D4N1_9CICH
MFANLHLGFNLLSLIAMAKRSLLFLYIFQGLLPLSFGQQRTVGPWRHRIQWENNGQVYSLMSTGLSTRLRIEPDQMNPDSSGLITVHSRDFSHLDTMLDRISTDFSGGNGGSVTVDNTLRAGPEVTPVSRQPAQTDRSISANPSGLENESEAPAVFPALTEENSNGEDMVNDDPRNPLKNHRNSVFYNMYPTRGRSAARTLRPPGTGYGTGYFQNGLPDLVPDPYAIQAGTYVQRMQMYALRCAAEENCLARSAYGPTVRDINFRVLLRFPQKVKNQGTADFLPFKPRYQWDWHSCHQHYHSMDAFSNYDLLDVITGRKVAEGHKASFCLEDTNCDPGFRRRYACTAHTQVAHYHMLCDITPHGLISVLHES